MKLLASSVIWVWALSVLLQSALFLLLFWKGHFRRLPWLTTYVALNLCQAAFLLFLYSGAGASLEGLKFVAWFSEAVTLVFQAFAATEAIRLVLDPYPGIWGLAWRTLIGVSVVLLAYIASHAASNYHWALLEAERGYHLIFASAIVACFALIRYYTIVVPTAFKLLLGGFCFFSCTIILVSTLFQSIWWGSSADYESIWQFTTVFAFAVVQPMWIAAVRKPLPADDRRRAFPSDEMYRRWTPQIDERLRSLNEWLMRLWKLEVKS